VSFVRRPALKVHCSRASAHPGLFLARLPGVANAASARWRARQGSNLRPPA
jgi:hypothetical protein